MDTDFGLTFDADAEEDLRVSQRSSGIHLMVLLIRAMVLPGLSIEVVFTVGVRSFYMKATTPIKLVKLANFRQFNIELASLPLSCRFRPDLAAMGIHDLFGDEEA